MDSLRFNCFICGAWAETPSDRLDGWEERKKAFSDLHNHKPKSPVILKVKLSEADKDSYSAVFAKYGVLCHQVAPVTSGYKAFFVSKEHCSINQAVRLLANSPTQLDAELQGLK